MQEIYKFLSVNFCAVSDYDMTTGFYLILFSKAQEFMDLVIFLTSKNARGNAPVRQSTHAHPPRPCVFAAF